LQLLGAATSGDLALLERTLLLLSQLSPFWPWRVRAGSDFLFLYLIWGADRPYVRAEMARQLDGGRGRLAEAVEAVTDHGAGALHLAAASSRAEVCEFLVEDVRVNVDALDTAGLSALSVFF
jgi:hypothetical protein